MNFYHEGDEEHEVWRITFRNLRVLRAFVAKIKFLRPPALCLLLLALAPSTAAQDKKLPSITVGYSAISGSFAPLCVAHDHGLFAKHGWMPSSLTSFLDDKGDSHAL